MVMVFFRVTVSVILRFRARPRINAMGRVSFRIRVRTCFRVRVMIRVIVSVRPRAKLGLIYIHD
jgi:hypothetical protein